MGTTNRRLNPATTNHHRRRLGRSSCTTIDKHHYRHHRNTIFITQRHLRHQHLYSRSTCWCSLPQPTNINTNISTNINHRRQRTRRATTSTWPRRRRPCRSEPYTRSPRSTTWPIDTTSLRRLISHTTNLSRRAA
jgi:hypothetical protein